MDKASSFCGEAFVGLESLIFSLNDEKEIRNLLIELNSAISYVIENENDISDRIGEVRTVIKNRAQKIPKMKTVHSQIEEAEEIIKAMKARELKKFKKSKVLNNEGFKIARLSEAMSYSAIARMYTDMYKKELEKENLADFSAAEVLKVVRLCKKETKEGVVNG